MAQILSLPPPEVAVHGRVDPATLELLARSFLAQWRDVILGQVGFEAPRRHRVRAIRPNQGNATERVFDRALLSLGTYTEWAIRSLFAMSAGGFDEAARVLATVRPDKVAKAAVVGRGSLLSRRRWAQGVLVVYLASWEGALLKARSDACPFSVSSITKPEDIITLGALALARAMRHAPAGALAELAGRLLEGLLEHHRTRVVIPHRTGGPHLPGFLSQMHLEELTLLARRDSAVMRLYGDKRVARLLQVRLAHVFTSLGFYVVESRVGERAVDLICISAQPGDSQTLLVEAKSTAGRYSLPVDDARALAEYAADVRRRLAGIPPPSCIVVMSHAASPRLPDRLRKLQAEMGTPLRFWTTQDLADLRENLTGHLPLSDLMDFLRKSDFVIRRGESRPLVSSVCRRHEATCETVRAQLNLPSLREQMTDAWIR